MSKEFPRHGKRTRVSMNLHQMQNTMTLSTPQLHQPKQNVTQQIHKQPSTKIISRNGELNCFASQNTPYNFSRGSNDGIPHNSANNIKRNNQIKQNRRSSIYTSGQGGSNSGYQSTLAHPQIIQSPRQLLSSNQQIIAQSKKKKKTHPIWNERPQKWRDLIISKFEWTSNGKLRWNASELLS